MMIGRQGCLSFWNGPLFSGGTFVSFRGEGIGSLWLQQLAIVEVWPICWNTELVMWSTSYRAIWNSMPSSWHLDGVVVFFSGFFGVFFRKRWVEGMRFNAEEARARVCWQTTREPPTNEGTPQQKIPSTPQATSSLLTGQWTWILPDPDVSAFATGFATFPQVFPMKRLFIEKKWPSTLQIAGNRNMIRKKKHVSSSYVLWTLVYLELILPNVFFLAFVFMAFPRKWFVLEHHVQVFHQKALLKPSFWSNNDRLR